jgi:type III restriction enzyme
VKGLAGTNAYLYLQSIEISSKKPPEARVEFEQKLAGGNIKRVVRKLSKGDNLFDLSNELDQYRDGFVVADINANTDTLSFTNGVELVVGEATGDVNEAALRRIQIREAIKAHFDKEQALFQQGIKVLDAVLHRRSGQVPRLHAATRKASTPASLKRSTTST